MMKPVSPRCIAANTGPTSRSIWPQSPQTDPEPDRRGREQKQHRNHRRGPREPRLNFPRANDRSDGRGERNREARQPNEAGHRHRVSRSGTTAREHEKNGQARSATRLEAGVFFQPPQPAFVVEEPTIALCEQRLEACLGEVGQLIELGIRVVEPTP